MLQNGIGMDNACVNAATLFLPFSVAAVKYLGRIRVRETNGAVQMESEKAHTVDRDPLTNGLCFNLFGRE